MKRYLILGLLCSFTTACAPRLVPAQRAWDGVPTRRPQASALKDWRAREARIRAEQREIESPRIQNASAFVNRAESLLGIPYQWGGESPVEGFDCSGLVHYVYAQEGIQMPRLANHQFEQGESISRSRLQPGDLVFFSISGSIVDHVGIYAGDERFIHAPRTGRTVSYDRLDSHYFASRYRGARRIN